MALLAVPRYGDSSKDNWEFGPAGGAGNWISMDVYKISWQSKVFHSAARLLAQLETTLPAIKCL